MTGSGVAWRDRSQPKISLGDASRAARSPVMVWRAEWRGQGHRPLPSHPAAESHDPGKGRQSRGDPGGPEPESSGTSTDDRHRLLCLRRIAARAVLTAACAAGLDCILAGSTAAALRSGAAGPSSAATGNWMDPATGETFGPTRDRPRGRVRERSSWRGPRRSRQPPLAIHVLGHPRASAPRMLIGLEVFPRAVQPFLAAGSPAS